MVAVGFLTRVGQHRAVLRSGVTCAFTDESQAFLTAMVKLLSLAVLAACIRGCLTLGTLPFVCEHVITVSQTADALHTNFSER